MKIWMILFIPFISVWGSASFSKAEYCQNIKNPFYFQTIASERDNRLSFINEGGAFDIGVCWWHSRFSRSALYLTIFRPELPRPNERKAKELIRQIKERKQIVMIPGYHSLYDFSDDWQQLIQNSLESWQISNTLIFKWIAGLTGITENTPENMKERMDQLYQLVRRGEVVYQKLQLPGISAHAWLVIGMQPIAEGYKLSVVDSNYSSVKTLYYINGDVGIYHAPYGGYFVPYVEEQSELEKIKKVSQKFCQ